MNCCKLLCLIIFISNIATAQNFIVLKKRSRVISTWFPGQSIELQLNTQQWLTAMINKIDQDSLYLRPYVVRTFINRLGFNVVDTSFYGYLTVSINSVHAFPKQSEGFSYIKNGAIFQVGAAGYLLLNIINTLSSDEPVFGEDNISKLGIAAAVFAAGTLLSITHKSTYILGKKYHIEYISSKPS